MVVMEWEYPILPPIPPAKKSLFQRLRDVYNRRKKKTLKGKRRWFEIFRRKNRNDSEVNASLEAREVQNEYQEDPNIRQMEEDQKEDRPDIEKPAQKKVMKTHVTACGIGFKSGKSKRRWSTPDSDEIDNTSVSKPPNESSKARVNGKPPVAPCKNSKTNRSRVPDTNMVASDDEDKNSTLEEKAQKVQEPKQLSELEKRAMEVDALIREVENIDVSSIRPIEVNREPQAINREPQQQAAKSPDVLDGLDELLDEVENGPVSRVCKPRRPKYMDYMDEVLDGMDDLMDDVYDDW